MNNDIWQIEENEYLINNYDKVSFADIKIKLIHRTEAAIRTRIYMLGLKQKDNREISKLLNHDLISFYYIGLLLADGYFISGGKNTGNYLGIETSIKDEEYIKKFAKYLNIETRYRTRSTNFALKYDSICCRVNDINIIPKIMKKFNINPRKSHNPPDFSKYNFTDKQILSLIIGFIDGDGNICSYNNNSKTKISIQLSREWVENLTFINNFIHKYFNFKMRSKISINNRNHACLYITKSLLIKNLKDFSIVNKLPIMVRKWDKVIDTHQGQRRWDMPIIS